MHIRTRVLIIAAVVAWSVWTVYPPGATIPLGLDLNGGVQLVLRVKTEDVEQSKRSETVEQALRTIERRVNELGVAEPVVTRYGREDRILVQLPGVSDVEQAKRIIKSTAQLRLTLIENGPFPSREAAIQAYANQLPAHLEVLPGPAANVGSDVSAFYVVQRSPAVSGTDLRDARASADEFNRPAVAFTLTTEAGRRFGAFTERNINRPLATVLDDRVASIATINSRIDDQGSIVGVSREEMLQQVITLKSGALPADLEYMAEHTVGASLGDASIRSGIAASAGGLALVGLFLLAYYRRSGINALISILVNLVILVGFVAFVPVTMTLPGVAGLILTIGMGVDSNILIFERIREELARARTARLAVSAAFDRVWITIVDTHVTSLVAAAFLFQFGTSPIRGFATTLTLGLLANVFTAVFVSRTLFEIALRRRATGTQSLGLPSARPALEGAGFRFSRWGRHALIASMLVIAAGVAAMVIRGLPLGIEFSGGTLAVVEFADSRVTEDDVRRAVAALPGDEVVQRYGSVDDRRFAVRLPLVNSVPDGDALETGIRLLTSALENAGLPAFQIADRELVSAAIGADLQRRGVYATAASLVAISAYIGLRFRVSFAVGAIAATLHDVLVTLGCLAIAGYDLSLNVTAALLTIIGYSVNDTIVIFDRVRENAKAMRGESLAAVVDMSVNQTLSRTVITAGATLLSVMALYLFGGEVLRGFAFTMMVGIVSGTYSTVFIASAIATRLTRRRSRRRVGHVE
jgi:protein-export membrane protein SecD/preprotein translocase SecF subunit